MMKMSHWYCLYLQLRVFVKSSRSVECAKLFRSLNEKIVAHARFTRAVLDASTVDLADPVCVVRPHLECCIIAD